jgi:hypothetical protein
LEGLQDGEDIKYAHPQLWPILASIYNQIFEKHESISDLKHGIIRPLNKKTKYSTLENLRPITLFPKLRKVLSSITLARIIVAIERFLSLNHHAYRKGRSTMEVITTIKWIMAMCEKYRVQAILVKLDIKKGFRPTRPSYPNVDT